MAEARSMTLMRRKKVRKIIGKNDICQEEKIMARSGYVNMINISVKFYAVWHYGFWEKLITKNYYL